MGTAVRRAAIRHVSTWTAWLRQPENALFVLLIAAHLVPIWAFRYFPTQDGGEHLNNANILRRYFTAEGAHFREYFVLNLRPDPNWSGHLVLAALLTVLPAILAEKLFVSAYIVLLPVSARYALRAIRPDAGWLAVLAFPFILNFLLHMGFYNFAFSLPAFFLVVGYWMLHKECIGFRETVVFTGLSLALYFTHPVTYVMASVLVVAAGLGFTLQHACLMAGTRQWHARALWQGFRRRVFTAAYAALPSICLLAAFVGSRSRQPGARAVGMWRRLRTLDTLISYAEPEVRLTAAVAGLFAIVAAYL
ncbi:hypothetical protein FJZ36_02670, partial [Candidatus Poribacteria bacterium]|nr:hypothetical protein [Candidatus Poribacteria bacterium]